MASVDSLDDPETRKRVAAEEPASGPEKKARTEAAAEEDEDDLDDSWADSVRVPSKPTPAAASSVGAGAAAKEARAPLERLKGADRDLKPAWMTKGLGVGKEIFGEATGELMKPGLTKTELEKLESQSAPAGPDPFGEVFRDAAGKTEAPAADPASADKLESSGAETPADSSKPAAAADAAAAEAVASGVSAAAEDGPAETASAEAPAEELPPAADAIAQARPEDALTVFVGNISFSVDEEQFELDFSECGEIDRLKFIDGKGMAFITYEDAEGVAAALKLDGDEYWGRALKVQIAAPRQAKEGKAVASQELFEVYVKGLSAEVEEATVRELFAGCGEIASMRLPRDEEGKAKGVAFLDFKTVEAMEKALESNGKELEGSTLVVEKARGREGKGGKGKGKDGKGKGKGKDKGKGKGKGKGGKGKGKGKGKGAD